MKAKIRQLLPEQWATCPSRLENLSLLISSIVKAKDLTQHALAAEMPLVAQDTSLVQRQRQWLMNEQVMTEAYYEPIIRPVLQSLSRATLPLILVQLCVNLFRFLGSEGIDRSPSEAQKAGICRSLASNIPESIYAILHLDTTAVGANCHLLSVAVGYQQRALPVAWQTGKGKRGHTKGERQIALLERTQTLLPDEADVIILGDGEFGHVTLLSWLQDQGYDYCLRVASDTWVQYNGHWCRLDRFEVPADETI